MPPLLIPVAAMGKCKQANEFQSRHYGHPTSLIIHERNQRDSRLSYLNQTTTIAGSSGKLLASRQKKSTAVYTYFEGYHTTGDKKLFVGPGKKGFTKKRCYSVLLQSGSLCKKRWPYMQFLAARSLWINFSWVRYSIPMAIWEHITVRRFFTSNVCSVTAQWYWSSKSGHAQIMCWTIVKF